MAANVSAMGVTLYDIDPYVDKVTGEQKDLFYAHLLSVVESTRTGFMGTGPERRAHIIDRLRKDIWDAPPGAKYSAEYKSLALTAAVYNDCFYEVTSGHFDQLTGWERSSALLGAASKGDLPAIKFLMGQRTVDPWELGAALSLAVNYSHTDCASFILDAIPETEKVLNVLEDVLEKALSFAVENRGLQRRFPYVPFILDAILKNAIPKTEQELTELKKFLNGFLRKVAVTRFAGTSLFAKVAELLLKIEQIKPSETGQASSSSAPSSSRTPAPSSQTPTPPLPARTSAGDSGNTSLIDDVLEEMAAIYSGKK